MLDGHLPYYHDKGLVHFVAPMGKVVGQNLTIILPDGSERECVPDSELVILDDEGTEVPPSHALLLPVASISISYIAIMHNLTATSTSDWSSSPRRVSMSTSSRTRAAFRFTRKATALVPVAVVLRLWGTTFFSRRVCEDRSAIFCFC